MLRINPSHYDDEIFNASGARDVKGAKRLLSSTFAASFADGMTASALGFAANLHRLSSAYWADAAIGPLFGFFFVFVFGGFLLHRLPFL
jgi:hypothetical protein